MNSKSPRLHRLRVHQARLALCLPVDAHEPTSELLSKPLLLSELAKAAFQV